MTTYEVGNNLLSKVFFFVYLVEDTLKIVELLKWWFSHDKQDFVACVFRRYFKSTAYMIFNQFLGIFCCRLIGFVVIAMMEYEVVAHTATNETLFYFGQSINGMVDI